MPMGPTTPKMQQPDQTSLASNDASHMLSRKARGGKPRASRRQNQAPKESIKSKNRLAGSIYSKPKESIDLTGDDSDTDAPKAHTKLADIKAQQQATTKSKRRRDHQHPSDQPSTPALTPTSLSSQGPVYGMATSDQSMSSPDRPSKRARCEDVIDTDRDVTIPRINHYHMAAPEPSVIPLRATRAIGNLTTQLNVIPTKVPSPVVNTNDAYHEPEAIPPKPKQAEDTVPMETTPPPNLSETVAPSQSACNRTETKVMPKPENRVKIENDQTQQKSISTPTLTEKISLAREFSASLGVAERDAYQQLMNYDWVTDHAVLAYLSGITTGAEGEGQKR